MIVYHCPNCGEQISVDDGKAGRAQVCGLCGQSSLVPADHLHLRRLNELKQIKAGRDLTSAELAEAAEILRGLGREQEAAQSQAAAARQLERERQAAALAAAGVPAGTGGYAASPPEAPAYASTAEQVQDEPPLPFPWVEVILGILIALPALIVGIIYVCRDDRAKKRQGTALIISSCCMIGIGIPLTIAAQAVTAVQQFAPDASEAPPVVEEATPAAAPAPSVEERPPSAESTYRPTETPGPVASATPDYGAPASEVAGETEPATSYVVTYEVEYVLAGRGLTMVTYQNAAGGTEQQVVMAPWSSGAFEVAKGQALSLKAQAQGTAAQVTPRIMVDGLPWKQATASGDYCDASVAGVVGVE